MQTIKYYHNGIFFIKMMNFKKKGEYIYIKHNDAVQVYGISGVSNILGIFLAFLLFLEKLENLKPNSWKH